MNPALSVLEELGGKVSSLLWVGSEGGMEEDLVKRRQIPYQTIPAAGLHGVGLKQLPFNLALLTRGYFASRKILREFKPDALLFTGGFVAAPMAIAGIPLPSLLYVPDIEPGMALKFISRFADRIALTAEESKQYFGNQKKLVITGYPIRSDLKRAEKTNARDHFRIKGNKPVLLVFGGSKGARTLNQAITRNITELLFQTQIIHITGKLDWDDVNLIHQGLEPKMRKDYHIFSYLYEDMGMALAAADLVLSRAGASTLGEFPLFGLPAILVPYPHAWRYQKINADYLVRHGAALMIENAQLSKRIVPVVHDLLADPDQLKRMSKAMRALARPNAARSIANAIIDLVALQRGKG